MENAHSQRDEKVFPESFFFLSLKCTELEIKSREVAIH
jgi:hypothetical protein